MLHTPTPLVLWKTRQKTLTLEGNPTLEYTILYPEPTQCGLAGRFLCAYYRHMAHVWEMRWQREVYLRACLDYAQRQASGKPFTPWLGNLQGELTLLEFPFLSLHFTGSEKQGSGNTCRISWGEVWNLKTGAPCHWSEFLSPPHSRSHVAQQIVEQGTQQARAGTRFFHPHWETQVPEHLSAHGFWLTEDKLHLSLPQCTISPAAEGTPEFTFPRKNTTHSSP